MATFTNRSSALKATISAFSTVSTRNNKPIIVFPSAADSGADTGVLMAALNEYCLWGEGLSSARMTRNIRVFAHTRISVAAHATSMAAIAVNQQKSTLPRPAQIHNYSATVTSM